MARRRRTRKSKKAARSARRAPRKTARRTAARKRGPRRKRSSNARYVGHIADAGVFCLMVLIGAAAVFAFIARDLPDTSNLWRSASGPKITLLAADGAPLTMHGASIGAPVRLADLPAHVSHAVLAVEDRNFYHHLGVNPISVARAAIANVRHGNVVQGGSTLTQQLAKNVFLNSDRTLKRKTQELMLALWLEHKFTKDEILTLYLNRVYFGAGAYGIDAASYRYFGKPARFLTLGESAVLAGLLKAPSRLAPTNNPVDAGKRGRRVVEQMVEAGFVSREKAAAIIEKPVLLSGDRYSSAPYFFDYILSEARAASGAIDADLVVHTTFDRSMQSALEIGFEAGFARAGDSVDDAQGAAVIMASDGAVRAMVGGRDYSASQFNRVTQARRQPGSAFKPFVYLAAAEAGAAPLTRVDDSPVKIGAWAPDNYKSKYYGEVSHAAALALSLNAATLRVQENVGRATVRRVARDAGWPVTLAPGPSLGLGVDVVSPLGLAGAYAPFANGGYRVSPFVIRKIETSDGVVIFQRNTGFEALAVSRRAIASINMMLEGVVEWGTGKAAAVPGYAVAGKTGTSQNNRDAWFAGHAGGLVCVVWVGRDDNRPMNEVTGGGVPARLWREIMVRTLPPRYVAPVQTTL